MKNAKKIITAVLVLVMLSALLTACAKTLSGTYSGEFNLGSLAGAKGSYTFSGSKVTLSNTTTLLGSSVTKEFKGTYEITEAADGTQSITFTFEEEDASSYNGTQTFSEGEDENGNKTIVIGGLTYTFKKK